MIKKYALTAVGMILAFAIAIGGWALTSRLIDIESDRMLYASMSFPVETPALPAIEPMHTHDDNEETHAVEPLSLTNDEIVSIIRNWNWIEHLGNRSPITGMWQESAYARWHEPSAEQINMTQAIEAARDMLAFLHERNIIPRMPFHTGANASLRQNVPPDDPFLPPGYSFWTVNFTNDFVDLRFLINALTGEVWDVEITLWQQTPPGEVIRELPPDYSPAAIYFEIRDILAAFTSGLDMEFECETMIEMVALCLQDNLIEYEVRLPQYYVSVWDYPPVTQPSRNVFMGPPTFPPEIQFVIPPFRPGVRTYRNIIATHRLANANAAAVISATGMLAWDGVLHFNRLTISLVPTWEVWEWVE